MRLAAFVECMLTSILPIDYSQTCVLRPPLGAEKIGRLEEVPDKNEIYTGR